MQPSTEQNERGKYEMDAMRQEHLTHQYVWAIQNESRWYHRAKSLHTQGHFARFANFCKSWMRDLNYALEGAGQRRLSVADEEFIANALWEQMGGGAESSSPNAEQGDADEKLPAQNETNHEKEPNMNMSQPAFETKSYIYGQDVSRMTEPELISAIKVVETEIAKLQEIKTKSKKIQANIEALQGSLTKIVEALDATA